MSESTILRVRDAISSGSMTRAALAAVDTVRRAARTYLQAFLTAMTVAWPADVTGAGQLADLAAAAAFAAGPALLAFLQGELEDAGVIRDRRQPKKDRP